MYDLLMQLKDYTSDDYVPLHMPGSKRNTELFSMGNPYGIDITEIDGFDNLHNAQGILKKGMIRAARLFGAEETLYLVNGSSAGIMAAICGATKKNDTVLVARNCHISVYNAIYLNELKPIYIYPQEITDKSRKSTGIYGKVSPQEIEKKLERNKEITAVVVTSPTYEGVVSDIEKIAQTVHRHNAVLIVDEAHGAHFPFSSAFPQTAVKCGADVVIQSIHKTLPAFTQTALLHLNGDRIDRERVKRYWNIYQTTSPSYILMAGIENCMTILENDGAKLFETYVERLRLLRENIESLKNISLLETDDISKIVLIAKNGKELYNILLNKYHIQLEMASQRYVIAMTAVGDREEYYQRFWQALQEIDRDFGRQNDDEESVTQAGLCIAKPKMNIYEALNYKAERIKIDSAQGKTAAQTVCFYPPGIPLLNPGEEVTEEIIAVVRSGLAQGLDAMGVYRDEEGDYILCLK
jgi:arginine/lysine/ornithine decarboxylase